MCEKCSAINVSHILNLTKEFEAQSIIRYLFLLPLITKEDNILAFSIPVAKWKEILVVITHHCKLFLNGHHKAITVL